MRYRSWLLLIVVIIGSAGKSRENKNNGYLSTSTGATFEIYPEFIGVNGNLTGLDRPWEKQELYQGIKKLNLGNFRYPAGSIGNVWDWDLGWIDQEIPDSCLIKWIVEQDVRSRPNRYTLDNLALGMKGLEVAPVFMLNMLTKDLDHSIGALKKADSLGMKIKYVELGNEYYFNLPLEMAVYPTPEDLGKTSKIWIDAIKKEFPDAKCAVVGTTIHRQPRHKDWNKRVLKYATNADAITKHIYSPIGMFGEKSYKKHTAGTEGMAESKITGLTPKERQKYELEILATSEKNFVNILTTANEAALSYTHMDIPENMDVWITEFNLRGDKSAVRGTWANSMMLSEFYNTFLENGQVKLTNVHNAIGPKFQMVYGDSALRHVHDDEVYRKPWSLSAGGLTMSYFGKVMNGMTKGKKIMFDNVPSMKDLEDKEFPALKGFIFWNEVGDKKGIIINYSGSDQKINTDFAKGSKISFRKVSSPLTHYVMDEKGMKINKGQARNAMVIKPYSITTFSY